ncbi:hypothetical protein NMY22_g19802 [Coprinellus aureogranulatus]|nr:hypothetical protein NMY22_g19802 [Coprinellus aureogranulatus]
MEAPMSTKEWSPSSWREKPIAQDVPYPDQAKLNQYVLPLLELCFPSCSPFSIGLDPRPSHSHPPSHLRLSENEEDLESSAYGHSLRGTFVFLALPLSPLFPLFPPLSSSSSYSRFSFPPLPVWTPQSAGAHIHLTEAMLWLEGRRALELGAQIRGTQQHKQKKSSTPPYPPIHEDIMPHLN